MGKIHPLIKGAAAITFLAFIGAILFPIFARSRESGGSRNGCLSNLKNIGLGFIQYVQDNDEIFPLTRTGSGVRSIGWVDVLQPYIKSTQVFECPGDANLPNTDKRKNPKKRGYTSYWMNANLSGASYDTSLSTASTIMSGDGNDGTDLSDSSYALNSLPPSWILDKNSPAYRHGVNRRDTGVGANYAFADGHVKMLKPSEISANAGNGKPSFAVR